MHVLVTGATGYIGGRLTPRLLRAGHTVRVLARNPQRLAGRPWVGQVEVVQGDLLDRKCLDGVFDQIDAVYYLVHSMTSGPDFARRDRQAATNFVDAAADVRHVVYLGGLQPVGAKVSRHLRSRAEIGAILAEHLPTTEFRAGPIIGSGSASFEMLRYLTERLPVMIAPHWVRNQIQPIAVRDVLAYLVGALERGPSRVVEIGSDRLTYMEMMKVYARVRNLHRAILTIPAVLPARLGARFISLVTPIPYALARPLVEGMSRPLGADQAWARQLFPEISPISYEKAVRLALCRIREQAVETRWSGALNDMPAYEFQDRQGLIREVRSLHVDAPPEAVFRVVTGLGGERGWLTWNWAWRIRGQMDRLLGGPGLRRGRRDPTELLAGETVDFWRVERIERPNILRLRAEAKLPGKAWLQWESTSEEGGTRLIQTASFVPTGLSGALYWYMLYPFHKLIFTDMIEAIGRNAMQGIPQSR